jgi:mono/diheme cytochrome c family protein
LSGVAGVEPGVLARLTKAAEGTPQRAAAVTTLAATIVRGKQESAIREVLEWSADQARPEWQRTALLDGAEAALLNAPLPGSGRRGGGPGAASAAANSTAPGARGGPGGAPAFPTASASNAGRGRGNAAAPIALGAEPASLVALAGSSSPTSRRAAALVARLTWPGKAAAPGDAPAVAPLTAAEQKRFEEGETIYASLCAACHQADGRGREQMAPTLVGSTFTLAPPAVPVRILLNGKEGQVGLMPPLGSVLTDDQIAAVLTYTRRAWGNQGAPVEAAAVGEIRKATTDRTRPWTEPELNGLSGGR